MTSRYDPHDDPRLAARLQAFADAPLATFDASLVVEAAVATAPRRGSRWQLVAAATAAIAIVVVAAAATDALWNGRAPAGGPPASAQTDATPTPTPRPYTGAENEYLPQLAACLREAGWDAVADPSGDRMYVGPAPADQPTALVADRLACEQQIGTPPTPRPLSEAEIRARWLYLLTARECLIGLGYAISEPPDEDTFVRSWQNTTVNAAGLTEDAPWSPYSDLPDAGPASWLEANRVCPQLPGRSPE